MPQQQQQTPNNSLRRRSPRLSLSSSTSISGERNQAQNKLKTQKQKHPHHHHHQQQTLPLALVDDEPSPLKIYHPTSPSSAANKAPLRRSPRLMAASITTKNSKCGSPLLLGLSNSPEKKACDVIRVCLGDKSDFKVRCLRSRSLPLPSHLAANSTPNSGKRKLDSREIPAEIRFSGRNSGEFPSCNGSIEDVPMALPSSSSMEEKLAEIGEERVVRRSPRGLTWSSSVDDWFEMESCKKMKKKKNKKDEKKGGEERREKSQATTTGDSSSEPPRSSSSLRKSCFFVGEAVSEEEARQRWGWRYQLK